MSETQNADHDEALAKTIKAIMPDVEVEVRHYHQAEHFSELWEWVGEFGKRPPCLVVVATDDVLKGQGTSETSLGNLDPWTAVDAWALAIASTEIRTRILILDLRLDPRTEETPGARRGLMESLAGRISVFHPTRPATSFVDDFSTTLKSLAGEKDTPCWRGLDGKALFRELYGSIPLTDRGSHHDCSNTLGAMIMLAGLHPSASTIKASPYSENPKAQAALSLVNALLVLPRKVGAGGTANVENSDPAAGLRALVSDGKVAPIEATLVDDRHEQGYGWVLSKVLGRIVAKPKGLVCRQGVLDFAGEKDGALGYKQDEAIRVLGKKAPDNIGSLLFAFDADVLFLDLMLWSGNKSEERKNALENYVKLAEEFLTGIKGDTNSPDPLCQALAAAPESHRALARLPLLLARLDPALPIVLFSSTQHRSVIQLLRDQPNIITDFSKPYIGGDDHDAADPDVVLTGLKQALDEVAAMVEVRRVWKNACKEWSPYDGLWNPGYAHNRLPGVWPPVKLKDELPAIWLRNEWLASALQKDYVTAATSAWQFLYRCLGPTRLAYLEKQENIDLHLSKIKRARGLPLVVLNRDVTQVRREIAIHIAECMIELFKVLSRGSQSEPDSQND